MTTLRGDGSVLLPIDTGGCGRLGGAGQARSEFAGGRPEDGSRWGGQGKKRAGSPPGGQPQAHSWVGCLAAIPIVPTAVAHEPPVSSRALA